MLLRRGEVAHVGSAAETISAYVNGVNEETQGGRTDSPLLIRSAELVTDGKISSGSRILIRVDGDVVDPARVDEHVRRRHPSAIDAEREGALCHVLDASGRFAHRA